MPCNLQFLIRNFEQTSSAPVHYIAVYGRPAWKWPFCLPVNDNNKSRFDRPAGSLKAGNWAESKTLLQQSAIANWIILDCFVFAERRKSQPAKEPHAFDETIARTGRVPDYLDPKFTDLRFSSIGWHPAACNLLASVYRFPGGEEANSRLESADPLTGLENGEQDFKFSNVAFQLVWGFMD